MLQNLIMPDFIIFLKELKTAMRNITRCVWLFILATALRSIYVFVPPVVVYDFRDKCYSYQDMYYFVFNALMVFLALRVAYRLSGYNVGLVYFCTVAIFKLSDEFTTPFGFHVGDITNLLLSLPITYIFDRSRKYYQEN